MTRRWRIAQAVVVCSAVAFVCGVVRQAHADFVATDLNTGGADTGFSSGWAGSSGVGITDSPDLTYGNYAITQSGTTERVYNVFPAHPDRQDSRDLATAMSNEVWFSVLVNVPVGGSFAGLAFHSDPLSAPSDDFSHNVADLRVLMSPNQLIVDVDGGALPAGMGSFAAGYTHLLLGKLSVVTSNDAISVWVNPNLNGASGPEDLPTADYTNSTVDFANTIVRIGVPGADDGIASVSVDAIRLSDTTNAFKDVTGVIGEADVITPTVTALSPANAAINVSVDTDLVITYSEFVQKGTNGNIVIQHVAGGTFETFPVASSNVTVISGRDVVVSPSNDFAYGTGYFVEMDAGAIMDLAATPNDFAGFSGSNAWSFTTVAFDATAPSVAALSPTNGANDVSSDTDLVITFDEDVQINTNGNIVIGQFGAGTFETIAVTSLNVIVTGSNVTINPTGLMGKGADYYVKIDNGAFQDLSGNPFAGIAGDTAWRFDIVLGLSVATDLNAGGLDTGFASGWVGSNNLGIKDAADLTYDGYFIKQTGTVERIYFSNTASSDRQDSRPLAVALSGEVWFSILVNVPAGGGFSGISFHSSTPSQPYFHSEADVRVLLTPSQLVVDLDGGDPPVASGTETGTFAVATTHLILGQMNVVSGDDTLNVWIDPVLNPSFSGAGNLPPANFSSTSIDFSDAISIVGVPGNKGSATEVYMDAIRLGDTATAFGDVTGLSSLAPAGMLVILR
jgi:hypothetical protein